MNFSAQHTAKPRLAGLTVIELTVVIAVLIGLIVVTFVGANAYRRSSDRAICIQQVVKGQKSVRSFANLRELQPGDSIADLRDQIIGERKFIAAEPVCPSGGTYTYEESALPAAGEPFMRCSIADHAPEATTGW